MRARLLSRVVLLLGAALLIRAHAALAQATLTGTVAEAEGAREVLPGATVFLSGTQKGTITDAEGRFTLLAIPAGRYEVVVTMPGYRPAREVVALDSGAVQTLRVSLRVADLRLPGLVVEDDGRAWRRNLERFTAAFLGRVPNAERCRIVNADVLRFGLDGDALLARSSAPLIIENRALGYRLTYALEDFEQRPSAGLVRWRGGVFFEALEPRDGREQRRWVEQRRDTYRGSLRHFLRTLATDEARRAGFRAYLTPTNALNVNAFGQVLTEQTARDAIVFPGGDAGTLDLRFTGFLQVVFLNEKPHDDYLASGTLLAQPTPVAQRQQAAWQHSVLELLAPAARFQQDGLLLDPYASTAWGYWAWENRISNMLPFEYEDAGADL